MKPSIVISQNDESLDESFKNYLKNKGFSIIDVHVKPEITSIFSSKKPKDASLGINSEESLNIAIRGPVNNIDIPIIVITKNRSKTQILETLKARLDDYLTTSFSYHDIVTSIEKSLSEFSEKDETNDFKGNDPLKNGHKMVGNSLQIQEIKNYIKKAAKTDSTVLITGETGTGKELVAELIHQNSSRQNKPFISINCTALPENLVESELFGYEKGAFTGADTLTKGKFEQAMGGTIFLDEIGDMSLSSQAKILRVIEKKEVYRLGGKSSVPLDFRIVAATNKNLESLLSEGKFRDDLYYRLNIARIYIPSLMNRKEDIPLLISHFIREMNKLFDCKIKGFSKTAQNRLFGYTWPGNVRELKNVVEASFISIPSKQATTMELPKQLLKEIAVSGTQPTDERTRVVSALLETHWNKSKAAKKLNWSRMTIYRKMSQYNIIENRHPAR